MVDGSAVTPTNLASNVYRFANLSAGPHTISIYESMAVGGLRYHDRPVIEDIG